MENVIPNPRGAPRGMSGSRFNGGRGGPPIRGRGAYNQRGGPGPRPRWDPGQQYQMGQQVKKIFLYIYIYMC